MNTRSVVQLGFLALTVGAVFLVGANAERWCPFGGIEAIYTYAVEGNLLCSLGTSNFFILGGVLLSVLLLRRAFCGYACPLGAIFEWTRAIGKRVGIRKPIRVPRGLDHALSLLKYAALGVILYFTWTTAELVLRGYDPCYALISRHGEDITFWAYGISGGLLVLSLLFSVPFCRWLCPLAAMMNPFSRVGMARVRRDPATCTDCGKCGKTCPMAIPVDEVETVTYARCTACLDCVDCCPKEAKGALLLRLPGATRRFTRPAVAALFVFVIATSVAASVLFPLPSFVWSRGELPTPTASLEVVIEGLECRGSANLLVYFLTRDDDLELLGPLRLEAWPGPGAGRARIVFDPKETDADLIRSAIVEPYFDYDRDFWRESTFTIEGYDPLGGD